MPKQPSIPQPIASDDAERLDYVADGKNYFVTLQMGGNASWGKYTGKKRFRQHLPNGMTATPAYEPVVHHRIGPYTGHIVNGLISSHNEWVADYNRKQGRDGEKWKGQVDRQLLVLETEETNELPAETRRATSSLNAFQSMIEGIVKQQVSDVLGTGA